MGGSPARNTDAPVLYEHNWSVWDEIRLRERKCHVFMAGADPPLNAEDRR